MENGSNQNGNGRNTGTMTGSGQGRLWVTSKISSATNLHGNEDIKGSGAHMPLKRKRLLMLMLQLILLIKVSVNLQKRFNILSVQLLHTMIKLRR